MWRLALLLAASLNTVGSLHAQSSRPALFAEVGYAYRVNAYAANTFNLERRHLWTSDLGLTVPVSTRLRVGAGTYFAVDEGGEVRVGFKARLRHRAGSKVEIELAPGIVVWDSRGGTNAPSPIVSASVFPTRLFGLTAQFQSVPTGFPGGTDRALYLGARMGGRPGRFANLVAAGVGILFGLAFLAAGGD